MSGLHAREFIASALKTTAGLILLPRLVHSSDAPGETGRLGVPPEGYPLVEASGSHADIGWQLGAAMKRQIAGHLEFSRVYPSCLEYLTGDGKARVENMLSHAQALFPHLVEELRGMADALEVPFLSLFAFNCRSEIEVLKETCGCSTICLRDNRQLILAHNEDGDDMNVGRMYLAHVTPPSGVSFISFVYPGLLPGNGPGFNAKGVVQTTNYIQPTEVADGVPRYFIGRAMLESESLDDAVELATIEPRAFSWHYNLASLSQRRLLSVETIAYPQPRHSVVEVEGTYIHTNHLLHPALAGDGKLGQHPYDVPYISSTTRMQVLTRALEANEPPASARDIMQLLTLHEGRPYSPCRHPEGQVHGVTLGTAVFEAPDRCLTLYHGNPCEELGKGYSLAG